MFYKTDRSPPLHRFQEKNAKRTPVAYLPQCRYAVRIAYGEFRVMIGCAKL